MKLAEFSEQKRAGSGRRRTPVRGELKQNGSQFNQEMKFKREELGAQRQAKLDEINAKSGAEQAKLLRELGITDPTTGKVFVDANGQPVIAPTETEAKEARATVRDSQTALSAIDELRKEAKALGPSVVKGKSADAFNTKLGLLQLQIKEAYKLGTLDNGSVAFLDKLTGGDPTKISTANIAAMIGVGTESGERVEARLKALGEGIERRALNQIGNPTGVKFQRAEEVEQTAANKAAEGIRKGTPTTMAAEADAKPRWLDKSLQDTESWLFGTKQQYKKDRDQALEGKGNSTKYPGFRVEQRAASRHTRFVCESRGSAGAEALAGDGRRSKDKGPFGCGYDGCIGTCARALREGAQGVAGGQARYPPRCRPVAWPEHSSVSNERLACASSAVVVQPAHPARGVGLRTPHE
jgi:hypothetical protein